MHVFVAVVVMMAVVIMTVSVSMFKRHDADEIHDESCNTNHQ